MFISVTEIQSHLRLEVANRITQGDDTFIIAALDAALVEIKSYLGRFDIEALFNKTGSERNALLVMFTKDIAVWHLINLCNAGAEFELRETRYKMARAWFKDVQEGELTPDFPLKPDDKDPSASLVLHDSLPKRKQHF